MGRRAIDPAERIRQRSIERYRVRAKDYDATCARTWPIREMAVQGLALEPGERVLDVGCGTGLSFGLLRDRVGEAGMVYGVEQSPEMAELARQRVAHEGWSNVIVIESSAHRLSLPEAVDALLFNYTHDICQSPEALATLFSQAKDGARVSVAGVKFMPWWVGPVNLYAYFKNLAYNGSARGMARPWKHLQRWVPGLKVRSTQFGMAYLAEGRLRRPLEHAV